MNQFGTCTLAEIKDIEKAYKIKLPDDYKQFLLTCNGASFDDNTLWPLGLGEAIVLDVLFGFRQPRGIDIAGVNTEHKHELLPHSILIGCDGENNFIMLCVEPGKEGIIYYDKSLVFEESDEESNTYEVADSFTELMQMVKQTSEE